MKSKDEIDLIEEPELTLFSHVYECEVIKSPEEPYNSELRDRKKPILKDPEKRKTKVYSIRLSDEEIEALLEIAAENRAFSCSGVTTGKPSWRALVHGIAAKRITCGVQCRPAKSPAEPKAPKAKKPWKGYWKHRASWWEPYEGNFMLTGEVVEKSGLTVEQLVAGGLLLTDDGEMVESPAKWGGWKYNKTDEARVTEKYGRND